MMTYHPNVLVLNSTAWSKTNGIVQPHNEVDLSAQVSGQIVTINPMFEVGSYFSAGDVLIELDATDYQNALAVD